jgi:hypothetical protein
MMSAGLFPIKTGARAFPFRIRQAWRIEQEPGNLAWVLRSGAVGQLDETLQHRAQSPNVRIAQGGPGGGIWAAEAV